MQLAGYSPLLEISVDGGNSYLTVGNVVSGGVTEETESEEVPTWNNEGSKDPVISGTTLTLEVTANYDPKDPGQRAIRNSLIGKRKLLFRFYRDKTDLSSHATGNAFVTSFNIEYDASSSLSPVSISMPIEASSYAEQTV